MYIPTSIVLTFHPTNLRYNRKDQKKHSRS